MSPPAGPAQAGPDWFWVLGYHGGVNRYPLIVAPTPLHRLPRLSDELGIDLWIKRDDLTGFALGGNKGRKLEFLMPEILARGVDTVVTCGANQSNFIRQLGVACRMAGLECHAVTMPMPYEYDAPPVRASTGGNLVLDQLAGVQVHEYPNATWDELESPTEELVERLTREGRTVYNVPLGGSSPLGAFAFTQAAQELTETFDSILTPSSSGSTQTGLAYHFHGTPTRIVGICADPEPEMVEVFASLAAQLDDILGARAGMMAADFDLRTDYVGPGYGMASEAGKRASERLLQAEGIFLDPIYTAKAFAGLLDLVEKREVSGKVLFWHTGGLPALFAETGEPTTR